MRRGIDENNPIQKSKQNILWEYVADYAENYGEKGFASQDVLAFAQKAQMNGDMRSAWENYEDKGSVLDFAYSIKDTLTRLGEDKKTKDSPESIAPLIQKIDELIRQLENGTVTIEAGG